VSKHFLTLYNNTYALSQTKKLLKRLHFQVDNLKKWIQEFCYYVQSKIEYSRKEQTNPRKKIKGVVKPIHKIIKQCKP